MAKKEKDRLGLGKLNYLLLLLASVLLAVGYIIISFNEIFISPVILIAVYLVVLPLALLYKPKQDQ